MLSGAYADFDDGLASSADRRFTILIFETSDNCPVRVRFATSKAGIKDVVCLCRIGIGTNEMRRHPHMMTTFWSTACAVL